MNTKYNSVQPDHKIILEIIQQGSAVLDLGCGSGELMSILVREKKAKAQGIDIDEQAIYDCVAKGLSVFHGDIDSGLADYDNESFDYVVLNQSLQQVRHFETVLSDALRVGKKVIVGFPNFAYYKARIQLSIIGKAPVTGSLPYQWYDSPNLHFLSISDFKEYCRNRNIRIEKAYYIDGEKKIKVFPNLLAQIGIFLLG